MENQLGEIVSPVSPLPIGEGGDNPDQETACNCGSASARARYRAWTGERIARLGFLIGQGWTAPRVSSDPMIAASQRNVYRTAQRLGLAFREAVGTVAIPDDAFVGIEAKAKARGATPEALMRLVLTILGRDPVLLENVIDDAGETIIHL